MNVAAGPKAAVELPPGMRPLVMVVAMLSALLVTLDQTIANVALPYMQTALGASPDTVTWVLTSYILANAVGTPITGWLTGRFGRSRLFIAAMIGFTVSSALCGLATSMPMMVTARLAQGFFGAFLMPLSQSIIFDITPPPDQPRAVMIWGLGALLGPMLGPILGGYLTESFSWRWVFFVNVPIGIVAVLGALATLPRFKDVRRDFDHVGFGLIVVALCSLQLALDRGTQQDWLDSPEIIIEFGLSIAAFWLLAFHLVRKHNAIISRALLTNLNFLTATTLAFVVVPIMIAGQVFLPPLVQTLLGYPSMTAGEMLMPRAAALTAGMIISNRLMRVMDGRILIGLGLILVAYSLHMQTGFNLQMGQSLLIWSGVVQGAGTGLAMSVINFQAMSSVPSELRTEASAVVNLMRNIGASIVIATASGLLARNVQVNHAELGSSMGSLSLPLHFAQVLGGNAAGSVVAGMADLEVNRQAMMIAYVDNFWLMMWAVLLALPVVLLVRRNKPHDGPIVIGE